MDKQEASAENAQPSAENAQEVAENVEAPVETKVEQKEEKITTPIVEKKDPKKVEAGRLSAISRAAKKRQREQLGVQEDSKTYSYWNPSSILYFGVPSVFLLGMFLWTIKDKKKVVIEYTPAEKVERNERLPEAKKKRETVSLFE